MVFFVVEEGEAVEPDHAVRDAAFAEALRGGFRDPYDYHGREDVGQCAGEFEHDDYD